jgi:tetratricopeptide (TPR) repeat protein
MNSKSFARGLSGLCVAVAFVGTANAELPLECGNLYEWRYRAGPWDYRTLKREEKEVVEFAHFTPDVESLRRGRSGSVSTDLDYTLRVIPNHHRALAAMVRLAERERRDKPLGAEYTVDCYFQRAMLMAPDDGTVRMLYGVGRLRAGHPKDAVEYLEKAREKDETNPTINYNLGLAYFDLKDYDKSLERAKTAYDGGVSMPALRDKLKRAGKWRE